MFIGDIWIDGAPTQFYFLFVPPIISLFIWLIELQNTQHLSIRIIHIVFCWFSLFDIFIVEFLIWSLRNIERMIGTKQFRIFMFYNFIIYLPFCVLVNFFAPKDACLPLGYFYPFSLFIFMLVYIPSTSIFLIIHDKVFITFGFTLLTAVYFPYSVVPLITSILGNLMWCYDIFHLSKCVSMPLEISDDEMVIIPSMREHSSRNHRRNRNSYHNHSRSRSRHQGINIDMANQQAYFLDPLNPVQNSNAEEDATEVVVRDEDVRQMAEMGFEEAQARDALVRSHNNVQRAVEILLNPE